MKRFFTTAGPIKADLHYHIDPLSRLDWEEIQVLIEQQKYFVLHAPRQTGKTTTLLAMMEALNKSGEYEAVYANIEAAQAARSDVEHGMQLVCKAIADQAYANDVTTELQKAFTAQATQNAWGAALTPMLCEWAKVSDKPCVLFLDEVDSLVGDTLISLLRQIRAGYTQRPNAFPLSIVLCGVRDVRDYRFHSGGDIITGGSAFNIKSASLSMGNFSQAEINTLYQQHTTLTGQSFSADIFEPLWQDTQGQPWLVNALADEMGWQAKENRDRNKPIELEDYRCARERLIYSRATHLDQLSDKLKEPRVHSVIAPMLATETVVGITQSSLDDLQYVEDLGLIKLKPQLAISNRIYQEVIPRELTYQTQVNISHEQAWYLNDDNQLDMAKLLSAFQQFFRENAESWIERFDYKEAGPQLLMQAFLQRIVNGGGRRGTEANAWSFSPPEVEARKPTGRTTGTFRTQKTDSPAQPFNFSGRINREYALGSRRTDVIIEWPTTDEGFYGDVQRIVIELKILHGALETCINKGLEQTADYADKLDASQAHLMVFNRDAAVSWDDKIWQRETCYQGREMSIWGC
ncbi:MAG: hypothetical protein ACI8WB_005006 [Phenylobacterium sp.]|jgi:hypothetical protein